MTPDFIKVWELQQQSRSWQNTSETVVLTSGRRRWKNLKSTKGKNLQISLLIETTSSVCFNAFSRQNVGQITVAVVCEASIKCVPENDGHDDDCRGTAVTSTLTNQTQHFLIRTRAAKDLT